MSQRRAEQCQLCGGTSGEGRGGELVAACRRCYKKSDSARVHRSCLERLVGEAELEQPPACPKCGQAYRLHVTWDFRLAWERATSCRSVSHAFEFVVVLLMVVCGLFTIVSFRRHEAEAAGEHARRSPEPAAVSYLIYGLFAATMLLVPFTLRKVAQRWVKANAEPTVVEIV